VAFDTKLIEAQMALELILTDNMPRIAWDALESGFDGPAIRRLAALERPTYFEVADVLPGVMQELGISHIPADRAGERIGRKIAQRVLDGGHDPLKHLRDFESVWVRAGYPISLAALATLDDEVSIARASGQSEEEIRQWVTSTLSDFLRLHND
jgi:hypothetical protein